MTLRIAAMLWALSASVLLAEGELSARDAYRRACELTRGRPTQPSQEDWQQAAAYLRQAREAPFTTQDMRWGDGEPSVMVTYEEAKARFAWRVRGDLIHCLCWLGPCVEREIAQLLEEPVERTPSSAMLSIQPSSPQLAGQAEATSGGRAMAQWFDAYQEQWKESLSYWLQRAQYYQGRKESHPEEQAWKAGLDLARSMPLYDRNAPDGVATRAIVLSYLRLLTDQRRKDEAIALASEIMTGHDCDSILAISAAEDMVRLLSGQFLPIDEKLWEWLDKRSQWDRAEEKMLTKIFRASRGEAVGENRRRAEALAKASIAGRSVVMATVLLNQDYPEHAAMFLKERLKYPMEDYLKHQVTELLNRAVEKADD